MIRSITVSAEEREQRGLFFRTIFGAYSGHIAVAKLDRKKKFQEDFFFYPDQMDDLHDWIERNVFGNNLYFCPQLFDTEARRKTTVQTTTCLWADLDQADPAKLRPVPAIIVETSPDRYQGYWPLETAVEPIEAEDYSRRIAYAYKDLGVDMSGWDLTQLLRVPLTLNYKYEKPADVPIVQLLDLDAHKFVLDDFKHLDQVPGHEYLDVEFPVELPNEEAEDILERHRRNLPDRVWHLFAEDPEDDWSTPLWNLECLLLESGMTREEAFIVCRDSACNKFRRDNRDPIYLWKDICRAMDSLKDRAGILISEFDPGLVSLLTEEEWHQVQSQPDTFVERYCAWGRSRGDASPEYHVAGAFTILSGILCGRVELPTSYGVLYPNLWFMLLADTTLTRKSTAIDMAMELLMDVDPDIVLATDGSIEGLLTTLSTRAGKPSIFWRDEFSGLLEAMKKKDYYAGMAEMFTKLYDGKYQKRILRKEVIEVRNPRLIIFSGGVYNRTLSLLDYSFVTSGFLPRFVLITAEADVQALRPLGPMTRVNDEGRNDILSEITSMRDAYTAMMTVVTLGCPIEVPKVFQGVMSQACWDRYNQMETTLLMHGVGSDAADLTTPTYDRLSKSILKSALLIAASERSINKSGEVEITMGHLLRAISYGDSWRQHVERVLVGVGRTSNETQMQYVLARIQRNPGVTRSKIMQNHHLNAREMDMIATTLEQRGVIQTIKDARTERYYPITIVDQPKGAPSKKDSKIRINQLGGKS